MRIFPWLLVGGALAACSSAPSSDGGPAASDASFDAPGDTTPDPDAASDAPPDSVVDTDGGDASSDAAADASPDAAADASSDAAGDASPDAAADASTDASATDAGADAADANASPCGSLTTDDNCGACGRSCSGFIPNGAAMCDAATYGAPTCVLMWCLDGVSSKVDDFLCLPSICRDCTASSGCLLSLDRCVDIGANNGHFYCGTPCFSDQDCAQGYECVEVKAIEGDMVKQCVPKTKSCVINGPMDLVVSIVSAQVLGGTTPFIRYTIKVCNNGTGRTPPVGLYVYLDRASAPKVGDVGDQPTTVPPLLNACSTLIVDRTLVASGTYSSWVQVDPSNIVSETNENNNVAGPVSVNVP